MWFSLVWRAVQSCPSSHTWSSNRVHPPRPYVVQEVKTMGQTEKESNKRDLQTEPNRTVSVSPGLWCISCTTLPLPAHVTIFVSSMD
jgi:hypothetical protein